MKSIHSRTFSLSVCEVRPSTWGQRRRWGVGGGRGGGRFAGRVKLQSQHLHISSWLAAHPARKSWSGKGSSNKLLATDPFVEHEGEK